MTALPRFWFRDDEGLLGAGGAPLSIRGNFHFVSDLINGVHNKFGNEAVTPKSIELWLTAPSGLDEAYPLDPNDEIATAVPAACSLPPSSPGSRQLLVKVAVVDRRKERMYRVGSSANTSASASPVAARPKTTPSRTSRPELADVVALSEDLSRKAALQAGNVRVVVEVFETATSYASTSPTRTLHLRHSPALRRLRQKQLEASDTAGEARLVGVTQFSVASLHDDGDAEAAFDAIRKAALARAASERGSKRGGHPTGAAFEIDRIVFFDPEFHEVVRLADHKALARIDGGLLHVQAYVSLVNATGDTRDRDDLRTPNRREVAPRQSARVDSDDDDDSGRLSDLHPSDGSDVPTSEDDVVTRRVVRERRQRTSAPPTRSLILSTATSLSQRQPVSASASATPSRVLPNDRSVSPLPRVTPQRDPPPTVAGHCERCASQRQTIEKISHSLKEARMQTAAELERTMAESRNVRQERMRAEEQVAEAHRALDEERAVTTKLKAELAQAARELPRRLDAARADAIAEANVEVRQWRDACEVYKAEIAKCADDAEQRVQEHEATAADRLQAMQREVDDATARRDELDAEVTALAASVLDGKRRVAELEAEVDDLHCESRELRTFADGSKRAAAEDIRAADDELRQSRKKAVALKRRIAELEAALEDQMDFGVPAAHALRAKEDDQASRNALSEEVARLKAEIAHRREQDGQVQSASTALRTDIAALSETLTAASKSKEDACAVAEARASALDAELAAVRAQHEEAVATLKAQLSEAEATREALATARGEERAQHDKDIAALRRDVESAKTAGRAASDAVASQLEKMAADAEATQERIKRELHSARAAAETFEAQLSVVQRENAELRAAIGDEERKRHSMAAELSSAVEIARAGQGNEVRAREEVARAARETEETLRMACKGAREEAAAARGESAESLRQLAALRSEISALEHARASERTAHEDAIAQLQLRHEAALSTKAEAASSLEAKIEGLHRQVDASGANTAELKEQLARARTELAEQAGKHEALSALLRSEIDSARAENVALRGRIAQGEVSFNRSSTSVDFEKSSFTPDFREALRRANGHKLAGEYHDEVLALQEAVRILKADGIDDAETFGRVLCSLGDAHRSSGNGAAAEVVYFDWFTLMDKASREPECVKALTHIGQVYHDRGDYDGARTWYLKAAARLNGGEPTSRPVSV